jgi:hypothetical protein
MEASGTRTIAFSWSQKVCQIFFLMSMSGLGLSVYLRVSDPKHRIPSVYAQCQLYIEILLIPTSLFGGLYFFMSLRGPYSKYCKEIVSTGGADTPVNISEAGSQYSDTADKEEAEKSQEAHLDVEPGEALGKFTQKTYAVDVLVPCYKEDNETIMHTISSCVNMDKPPWVSELRVFLLDDGGDDIRIAMCEEVGVNYIRRPNRGQHAKAGNMNYALSVTHGDFVMFFDADMAPIPVALTYLSGILKDAPDDIVMVQVRTHVCECNT